MNKVKVLVARPFSFDPPHCLTLIIETAEQNFKLDDYEKLYEGLERACLSLSKQEVLLKIHTKEAVLEAIEKENTLYSRGFELMLQSAIDIKDLDNKQPLSEQWDTQQTKNQKSSPLKRSRPL